jgi:hypothetical protein
MAFLRFSPSALIDTREQKVDDALIDSFPASDPPPWTFGKVPGSPLEQTQRTMADAPVWSSHTTVIVAGGQRTVWQWMATGLGAIGTGMLIPIAILAIGIPVAVATLILVEVATWLAAQLIK